MPKRGKVCSLLVLTLLVVSQGCSQQRRALSEIDEAYAQGEYREAIALCKHTIRRNIANADVYNYYGRSLLALGRDYEAFKQFDVAVAEDAGLSTEIGHNLFAAGVRAAGKNRRPQAARRMQKAVEYNAALELRGYRYLVADAYFEQKDFMRASHYYRSAIEIYPDTSSVQQAYLRLAESSLALGAASDARDNFEMLLDRFPRGTYRTEAKFKLSGLIYQEAEKQHVLGNYEQTIELVTELMERELNPGMNQKSQFLLGETYEAMSEFDLAFAQYRAIIKADRGASGRIVERAREKIMAFREAGLD